MIVNISVTLKSNITVKRKQGCSSFILLFSISMLLASFNLKADGVPVPTRISAAPQSEPSITNSNAVEEGWVEKQIAPPTQWVESVFAPFTQWMEDGIQQQLDIPITPTSGIPSNPRLISVQQAINTAVDKYPGKVLRSQFKTGPPPYYKIKLLSDNGTVLTVNVHAFNGKLFIISDAKIQKEEAK